ncbi:MAG: hypothetical protein ACQEXV_04620 [Bacillota bacterium]
MRCDNEAINSVEKAFSSYIKTCLAFILAVRRFDLIVTNKTRISHAKNLPHGLFVFNRTLLLF